MKRLLKWIILKLNNLRIRFSVFRKKPEYFKVSFLKSMKMRLKGFTPDHYYLYDFKHNNPKDYLTEVDRWKTRRVNDKYNVLLDDSLAFYHLFKSHVKTPKIFGWINKGKIYDIDFGKILNLDDLFQIIKENKKLIFKPNSSGGGSGVFVLEYITEDAFLYSNLKINKENLEKKIIKLNNYIISEYLDPKVYSNQIYDKNINTIRIVTIINEDGKAIIPVAMHRFGTEETIPVDNVCSGGIFSMINLETGIMSEAKSYRTPTIFTKHPNSNKEIKGQKIENWDKLKNEVKEIASKFPFISFMAWDIVPYQDTFYVLEINASTGLTFIQMFEPLKNTELGKFYIDKMK